jgi:hypothetical protein
MNKIITTLLSSAALAATAFAGTNSSSGKGGPAITPPAADNDLGGTLSVGYDSDYYFRGLSLGEDWVSANLGFGVTLTEGLKLDLGAYYGSSFDSVDDYDRLVLSAGLTKDFGVVDASLGYRFYSHNGLGGQLFDDTNEIYVGVGAALGPINVALSGNYDVEDDSFYFDLGVNSEIKVTEWLSFVPGANIGYGVDYNYQTGNLIDDLNSSFGTDFSVADGFTAVTVSLAAPIKLSSRFTIVPYIAGRLPVDALDDLGEDNEVYGGVSLSVKF